MAGAMQGGGPGQPHATEYTLQGVMRFLQTEWHRHERDRNAWEIERQEMKGRIATLEGQARRSDATQKALKKYVAILQNKVREQAVQLSGREAPIPPENDKDADDRAAKIKEKLKSAEKTTVDPSDPDIVDDDAQRSDLKTFLDNCHSEFTYLMVTPANPLPPRESPQLPLDDLREGDMINLAGSQPPFAHVPNRLAPNHLMDMASRQPGPPNNSQGGQQQPAMTNASPQRQQDAHQPSPMVRSVSEHPQSMFGNIQHDWGSGWGEVGGNTWGEENGRVWGEESNSRQSTVNERLLDRDHADELASRTETLGNDAWNLDFPPPGNAHATPKRPDTDVFPSADNLPRSPGRSQSGSRRKGSMSRKRSSEHELSLNASPHKPDGGNFKLRYGLRGHLSTVRTVIFSGGGSPGEPEICTAGDDGTVKRFLIPRLDSLGASDHDVKADFTHRGHTGAVLSVTSWSPSPSFSTGGRAQGDGWIFSGGQDATIRVWERGRVDPKATLEGHTDAVWALCVLPATLGAILGPSNPYGPADRILLVSGAADGTVRLWSVSAPPQLSSPQPSISSARVPGAKGRVRGNSMSSGSAFPATPQPTMASNSPFHHTLIHTIVRPDGSRASPTCIAPLSPSGESFVVAYADAAVLVFDTRSGEQIASMTSLETYDGTQDTAVNAVAATTIGFDQGTQPGGSGEDEDGQQRAAGPTGGSRSMGSGVEGTIISGHEDRGFVRFYDANSGQCTYNMVAHPAAISSLSLSPDGRELVTAGHDASLRFWNLENRTCIQEITTHRIMRGEGVCAVVWSQDGRWVISGGGDGVVKVFAR